MADGPRVTLLGTGTMGVGMAHSLLRAGLPTTVWNRHIERARPLADDGATVAGSIADAVRSADVVVTMLFDADSVGAVVEEAAPDLPDHAVWVQSSTVGRDGIASLARLADEHGIALVDAPVVGTRQPAEEGALVVLASGPSDARERARPVLAAVGSRTVDLGDEVGAASAMKLVANAWVASITTAAAQSIALARGFGLDPADFLATAKGGVADSGYLQLKGGAMLEARFDPQFALDGLLKDLRLVQGAAGDAKVPTVLADALVAAFERSSDAGHGGQDIAAVLAAFEPERVPQAP